MEYVLPYGDKRIGIAAGNWNTPQPKGAATIRRKDNLAAIRSPCQAVNPAFVRSEPFGLAAAHGCQVDVVAPNVAFSPCSYQLLGRRIPVRLQRPLTLTAAPFG